MARSIGSQLALRLVTQLTASGVSQWKDQMGPSWRRYTTHWLITLVVIFVTLLLYGLLIVPVNRPIYTVTHDIRLAQSSRLPETEAIKSNGAKHISQGSLSSLDDLTQYELRQVVAKARRAGVIQQAVDGLAITDRVHESRIEQIKIVTFVDATSGKSMARVKVLGESAEDAEKVARVVGTTLLRYVVKSGNLLEVDRDPLAWRRAEVRRRLDEALADENESFESLRSSWTRFQRTAEALANSTPVANSETSPVESSEGTVTEPPDGTVNPDWIVADRRLRQLRRERAELIRLHPADRELAERMEIVVRDAHESLNRTPIYLAASHAGAAMAEVRPLVSEPVAVKEDAESADWLDFVVSAPNQITPMVELHDENREQLLAKIREFLPGATGPTIIIGWSESAPEIVAWGQGISSRTFVLLLCLCVVLSVILSFWLARVTAMERIHDLRELASSSLVPVIAAVNTGVARPQPVSIGARVAAIWTRRLLHVALLLYIVVFVAASLTPNGSLQSFWQNPREMLGQAALLFSSMS